MTDPSIIERLRAGSDAGQIELKFAGTADQPDYLPGLLAEVDALRRNNQKLVGLLAIATVDRDMWRDLAARQGVLVREALKEGLVRIEGAK